MFSKASHQIVLRPSQVGACCLLLVQFYSCVFVYTCLCALLYFCHSVIILCGGQHSYCVRIKEVAAAVETYPWAYLKADWCWSAEPPFVHSFCLLLSLHESDCLPLLAVSFFVKPLVLVTLKDYKIKHDWNSLTSTLIAYRVLFKCLYCGWRASGTRKEIIHAVLFLCPDFILVFAPPEQSSLGQHGRNDAAQVVFMQIGVFCTCW